MARSLYLMGLLEKSNMAPRVAYVREIEIELDFHLWRSVRYGVRGEAEIILESKARCLPERFHLRKSQVDDSLLARAFICKSIQAGNLLSQLRLNTTTMTSSATCHGPQLLSFAKSIPGDIKIIVERIRISRNIIDSRNFGRSIPRNEALLADILVLVDDEAKTNIGGRQVCACERGVTLPSG